MAKETQIDQKSNVHEVPWGPVAAVLLTVGIFFGSQLLGGLLVSIYPAVKHWKSAQAESWLNDSVLAQFAYVVIVEASTLLFLRQFLRGRHATFKTLGLKSLRFFRDIGYGLTGFTAYFITLYIVVLRIVQSVLPRLNIDQKQQLGFDHASGTGPLLLVFISLVILPPITEEILVRGFLYSGLRRKLSIVPAALATSLLFALPHLQLGDGAAPLWIAAIDTFILSLFLIYLRERTGSLWASIFLHMLKNGVAFASLFLFHLG